MKKIVIFYFSGTGNTWWVSKRLAFRLRELGWKAKALSIEKLTADQANEVIAKCDTIGFAYPIYGSDLPRPMKDFIAGLAVHENKKALVCCTQAMFSGDGARVSLEFLKDKGFTVWWGEHFNMPNNITASWSPLSYRYSKKEVESMLRKADLKIERLIEHMVWKEPLLIGFNTISKYLGAIQRVPYRKVEHMFKNMMTIDESKCTRCGLCAKLCPVQNFTIPKDKDERCQTHSQCIQCMRCYNHCPTAAILSQDKPHNFKRGTTYKGPVKQFNPRHLRGQF